MVEKSWFEILVNAPWMGTVLGVFAGGIVSFLISVKKNRHELEKMGKEFEQKESMRKKAALFLEKKTAYVRLLNSTDPTEKNFGKFKEYFQALSCVELFGNEKIYEISSKVGQSFLKMHIEKNDDKKEEALNDFARYLRELKIAMIEDIKEHA